MLIYLLFLPKGYSEELMKGKYSTLSETEIERRVKLGIFKEDPKSRVIRDSQNKLVRFLDTPQKDLAPINSYHNQYVQVNNTYITYTDTQKIIKEILDVKNQEIFLELIESHKVCINFLQQYQNSKNPKIIQKLNESAVLAISKYQVKLTEYLKTEFNLIDQKRLLDTCSSYLDLIKIYKFSSYLYHHDNTLDYHDVKGFIADIFLPLQLLFESLVCELSRVEGGTSFYNCSSSLYMKLFLKRNSVKLSQYSSMDSRFGSLERITNLIAACFQKDIYNVHEEQEKIELHEDFTEDLYQLLVNYDELNSFNELFNPNEDNFLIEDQSLKNLLLPSSKRT